MNIQRAILIAAGFAILSISRVSAGDAPQLDQKLVDKLLRAVETTNYKEFTEDGEENFAKIDPAKFNSVAASLKPRLEKGFEVSFLGTLNQQGYHVSIWKLIFKAGGDDALVTLSLKNDKVGGFWIR